MVMNVCCSLFVEPSVSVSLFAGCGFLSVVWCVMLDGCCVMFVLCCLMFVCLLLFVGECLLFVWRVILVYPWCVTCGVWCVMRCVLRVVIWWLSGVCCSLVCIV